MATYQQYLGRFWLAASTLDITSEPQITIPAGYYYTAGYTGETDRQLCEELQAQIRANTSYTSATVAYASSTGKITITIGTSVALTFGSTGLRDALGFTGDSSAATSHTSDAVCRYVWRPSRAISDSQTDPLNFWQTKSTTIMGMSRDGTPWSVAGVKLKQAEIVYKLLPQADAVASSDASYYWSDFESFFNDVIHEGQPIRCYPDRSLNTATDYTTAVVQPEAESLGMFSDLCKKSIASFLGLWDVTLPLKQWFGTTPVAPTVTGLTWNYFDTTLPAGVSADIEALYAFDGNASQLLDLTANDHDLTGSATAFNTVVEGFVGLGFNGSIYYSAAADAGYQITGDMTFELILFSQDVVTQQFVFQCGSSGTDSTAANNTLYATTLASGTNQLVSFHEYSGGTNVTHTAGAIMPTGTIHQLTFVRSSTTISFYQDSTLTYSVALSNPPTGGSNGYLRFGADETGSQALLGVIFSARLVPEAYTAAQVLQSYERVRGLAL